ncbi:hypothetical protein [Parasphingopyxis sp.]|uniref:hypothetical protein n=1 Tax=Parasphingopyxis sp. TaxID=1920299 RepID=UPI002603BC54|nr:hypothetical protein [Parasphingopyxis sp.]
MARLSVLAFAAASKRVGVVYLEGNRLLFWQMSTYAGIDHAFAEKFAKRMIKRWQPDVIVTERADQARRKGARTKAIITTLTNVADDSPMLSVAIERRQRHRNKYKEAAALAERHPHLARIKLKPRRVFDDEPRATVVFEAVALAESVKEGPIGRAAATER